MKRQIRMITPVVLSALMAATAGAANHFKPTKFLADQRENILIEPSLPSEFSNWRFQKTAVGVVNPQQQKVLEKIYTETITRVYVNDNGYRIMLSIAYGKSQRDELQVHRPELCYPAQGFQVERTQLGQLETDFGPIPVRQLMTRFGSEREEPVTYWTTIGNDVVVDDLDKKLREIDYALEGIIPDGLLFRVSSIESNKERAYEIHADFVKKMIESIGPRGRARLAGLREGKK